MIERGPLAERQGSPLDGSVSSFRTPNLDLDVTVIRWPTRTVEEHAAEAGLMPDDPAIFQAHVDRYMSRLRHELDRRS